MKTRVRAASSSQTFLYKYLVAAVPVLFVGFLILALFLLDWEIRASRGNHPVIYCVLAAGLPLALLFGFRVGQLKRIRFDASSLLISNYLREIRVPIRNVAGIEVSPWHLVVGRTKVCVLRLTFEPPSDMGRHIHFVPGAQEDMDAFRAALDLPKEPPAFDLLRTPTLPPEVRLKIQWVALGAIVGFMVLVVGAFMIFGGR